MNKPYNFPKATAFGKIIPKSKIYQNSKPTAKVKRLFTEQVEKIIWSHKLSKATINLSASAGVQEIQVFNIALKTATLAPEVLQTIDMAVPSPILFELNYRQKTCYTATYKRPNIVDKNKVVISSYFKSAWFANVATDIQPTTKLPVVLTMSDLYQSLLQDLIQLPLRRKETVAELVTRADSILSKNKEIAKLETKIRQQKQYNRQVEFNQSLNTLKQEIAELKNRKK